MALEVICKQSQEGKALYRNIARLHSASLCSSLLRILKVSREIQKPILTKLEHLVVLKGRLEGANVSPFSFYHSGLAKAGLLKLGIWLQSWPLEPRHEWPLCKN